MSKKVRLALVLVFFLSGCARRHWGVSPVGTAMPPPSEDAAVVIFLAPKGYPAPVFEVFDDRDDFIGFVDRKTKVARRVPPGTHLFMVVGESADFLRADVAAGRTYYARVAPRMGWWVPRFSLLPIKGAELSSERFAEWEREAQLVEKNARADTWVEPRMVRIANKRQANLAKWKLKSADALERYTLRPEDGR
jgi:hypothetical protein